MMKNDIRPYLSLTILVWFIFSSSAIANEREKREIVNRARQATVYIETNMGQGSGFFVTRDVIVTNFHVIENVRNRPRLIKYWREGQQNWSPVKSVLGYDVQRDLAILKVSPSRVLPLVLSDSDSVEPLDSVYVAGFPKQSPKVTISKGNISAIHDKYRHERLQFTAPISGGSSGGPVLNDHGEVVGVVTSTRKSEIQFNAEGIEVDVPQNLNMAIPSKHLKTLLRNHSVRLPRIPKRKADNREPRRENEDKAKAEVERAKADTEKAKAEKAKAEARKVEAEARRVEAEAKKVEAEAKKAEAVARKTEAERDKAEAEKARAESKTAKAEHTETEAAKPKKGKAEAVEPEASIIDQLQAATVHIYGRDRNGNEGRLGSGFFVREDQVATDFHVVDGSTLKGVKPIGQVAQSVDALLAAKVLKTKKARHLAILQVETAGSHPLTIGNSEKVEKGGEIRVFSDAAVPKGKFSKGIISDSPYIDGVRFFQFDAPVSPGSSGGPIVNSSGEVVAVVALKVPKFSETFKYAIPSIYLEKLLTGTGDSPPPELPDDGPDSEPKVTPAHDDLLKSGIDLYKAARFREAVEYLQSVLNSLVEPTQRALAHLYLGFSKWGLAESESSVSVEFREALRYDPSVELPTDVVGQNHPVFRPLLEQTRKESTGTLTISASPPESEIRIYGGEIARLPLHGSPVRVRLFRGNYAVEGRLNEASKVESVVIDPSEREAQTLHIEIPPPESQEFEITLDLFSAEKPKEVTVHYTIYDANGNELNRKKEEMQFREHKPETSIWVYHVKLPSAVQGGKIVYRIEADGKVIRDDPMQVEILEPPESAFIDVNQTVPIKARVISNVEVSEVRVVYDAPTALASSSPSVKLEKESSSNTYIGNIPTGRKHTDGTTWFNVTAKNNNGDQNRSATRAVRAKQREPVPIKITLEPVPDPLPINKPINIKAEVKSSTPLKEVRLYYDFPRKQLSETSPSTILESKSGTDTYTGKIPKDRNLQEGYIWFFVMVTTERGMKSPSEDSVIEVRDLEPPMHQGIWASHSWSNLASDDGFYSGWERGDVLSLAFLREGKGVDTLGAQLDYTYENPDYIGATVQWGPSARDASVVFAFLAGAAGYRSSDPEFSRVRQSRQITPLLGGSMRFFPLDRVALDLTGTMKLRSDDSTPADREPSFADDFLHHYELGIRLYISPSMNLKAGYGRWRFGGYDNASVQVGLGATF